MSHRVAILGGGIGAQHLDGYISLGDRFTVTHICDLNPDVAQAQAARVPGAMVARNIAAILADPMVEVVDICLPPGLHVAVTCDALAAGKHVICEKPLAGSVADVDKIRQAVAGSSGRKVFPVFQYRFGPRFAALDALGQAGLLGTPRVASLETHWNRDAAYYATPWRGTWAHEMGGAVLSHAIHIHDLISHCFGPVAEVSAMLGTMINPVETEDCAAISLRMKNGALVTSSVTLGAADDTSRMRLVYEHMTVESGRLPYTPAEDTWTFTARDPARQTAVDAIVRHTIGVTRPVGFAGFLASVATSLEGCAPTSQAVMFEDGASAIELVTAIYHADRTGQRAYLPLDRNLPICQTLVHP